MVLPKPPSVNHLYGHNKWGGLYLKKEAKDWLTESMWILRKQEAYKTIDTPVRVEIEFYTWMISDLDNILKITLDFISKHAEIVKNDNLVFELYLKKIKVKRDEQKLVISIEKI